MPKVTYWDGYSGKAGEQEFTIKNIVQLHIPRIELGVEVSIIDGKVHVQKGIPYTHVEIPTKEQKNETIIDGLTSSEPVFHNIKNHERRISGEICYTMTTLTPTIVGNDQYKNGEQNFIEPIRLQDENNRVAISGSSLKGMLRQSLGALTASPMQHVAEKTYSYRPNAVIKTKRLQTRLAIVVEVENSNPTKIKILPVIKRNVFKYCDNLIPMNYRGGTDGQGILARAFDGSGIKNQVFLSQDEINNAIEFSELQEIMPHYAKTRTHLADTSCGLLTNDHPLSDENSTLKKAADAIKSSTGFEKGQVIYVEVEMQNRQIKRVTSIGHNFRYHWRYRDSILRNKDNLRTIVSPLAEEKECSGEKPQKLSSVRSFLGYVSEGNPCVEGIGKGDFKKLAGRIAFNMAVEVIEDNTRKRFMNKDENYAIQLKTLGTPKASAVEYYLDQSAIVDIQKRAALITYGDLHDEEVTGELGGRKFYWHQPQAAHSSVCYKIQKNMDPKLSSKVKFVSSPGTKYQFTLRFRNLRKSEIALILIAMNPNNIEKIINKKKKANIENMWEKVSNYFSLVKNFDNDTPMFANKIGYGKPLGLGSVNFHADKIYSIGNNLQKTEINPDELFENMDKKLKKLADNGVLLKWLQVHQYRGQIPSDYPKERDKQGEETIYAYHSNLRSQHLAKRRN